MLIFLETQGSMHCFCALHFHFWARPNHSQPNLHVEIEQLLVNKSSIKQNAALRFFINNHNYARKSAQTKPKRFYGLARENQLGTDIVKMKVHRVTES